MGFWDTSIGDLEALGVPVSDDQRFALNHGGEVLIVQHLLSYGACEGDDAGMHDEEGEPVFIPQRFTATGAMDPNVTAELETEYGEEWRTWPSYTGHLSDTSSVDQRFWSDEPTYMRVWEGIPIIDGEDDDVVARLFTAASRRINDSVYDQLCVVTEFDGGGYSEYGLDDLLPLVDLLAADPELEIEDLDEYCGADDPGYLKYVALAMKELIEGNYMCFTTANSPNVNAPLNNCSFMPMEHYLHGDHEAMAVWRRLVNRRENALAIITAALPRGRVASEFDREERRT